MKRICTRLAVLTNAGEIEAMDGPEFDTWSRRRFGAGAIGLTLTATILGRKFAKAK